MNKLSSTGFAVSLVLGLAACSSANLAEEAALEASAHDDVLAAEAVAPVAAEQGSSRRVQLARNPLDWSACGQLAEREVECAELVLPAASPHDAGELTLSLRRVLAQPGEARQGTLLFHLEGQGAADGELHAELGTLAPGYDLVGFEVLSGERGCGLEAAGMYRAGSSELTARIGRHRVQVADCERPLDGYRVATGLEELRGALQEPALNFYGAFDGVELGELYAQEYPDTTGFIVVDGDLALDRAAVRR
jgi:hypothetical protein